MLYSYGYCYFPQRRRAAERIDLSLTLWPSAKHGGQRGSETRRGAGVIVIIACTFPPYSVLGESNKCEEGTQRRKGRRGRRACVMGLGRECAHYRLLLLLLLQNLTKQ